MYYLSHNTKLMCMFHGTHDMREVTVAEEVNSAIYTHGCVYVCVCDTKDVYN